MAKNSLVYDVNDKPKFSKLIGFAFQQVLAVLAATIAVPTIINMQVNIPAAILGAGLGTLVYLLFTKFKSPVIISSSFAFLGALSNALAFGYMGIALGSLFAGLVYVVIALVIKLAGTKWIEKIMPPVVIGPTVALIGLSLASSAMGDMVKANGTEAYGTYNLVSLICGLVTFFTIVMCTVQNKKKNLRLFPFIIGILVGYLAASIFSIIGYLADVEYLKIISWKPIVDNFSNLSFSSFFQTPNLSLVEGIKELTSGEVSVEVYRAVALNNKIEIADEIYNNIDAIKALLVANNVALPQVLNGAGIATVALAFVPVAFVTYAEHVADHINLGTIINRHLIKEEPGLTRTLLGDGVGSIVGTFFGICPNTTYGESVGCVAITKNASIRTIFSAALMLIVLAFFAPLTSALRTIPSCVMGGVCLTLYGFIAVSGLKMFKFLDLSNNKNLFTVAAILIAGIGGLAIKIPYEINGDGVIVNTIEITSIATALILGIITYVVCNKIEKHNNPEVEDNVDNMERLEEYNKEVEGK